MSNGPNRFVIFAKEGAAISYSVSFETNLDSISAIILSVERIYEAKIYKSRDSHHCHIDFARAESFGKR